MKKKIFAIFLIIFLSITSVFAANDSDRIPALLNYIQLSVCKILESESKGMLEDEFVYVLNNIEPSSLRERDLIDGYQYLLATLTELKISSNERVQLEKIAEQKRKDAIFNSLNSFGSILFVPSSKDPVSIGISLAYSVVNAGFNYARAVKDIDIEKNEKKFQIDMSDLRTIDAQRSSLFITTAKIYRNRPDSSEKVINELEMRSFAKIMQKLDSASSKKEMEDVARENINILRNMENNFKNFSPYWLTIGKMHLALRQFEQANNAFSKVFDVDNASDIFKNHKSPYIKDAAKQAILFCMENSKKNDINKYLKLLKDNSTLDQASQDDNSYFYCTVYLYQKDFTSAKKELDFLSERKIEPEYGDLFCQYNLLTLPVSDTKYKQSETMLKAHIMLNTNFENFGKLFHKVPKTENEILNGSVFFKISTADEIFRFEDVTGNNNGNKFSSAISKDLYFTEQRGFFKKKEVSKKITLKIYSITIRENGVLKTYCPNEVTGKWIQRNI